MLPMFSNVYQCLPMLVMFASNVWTVDWPHKFEYRLNISMITNGHQGIIDIFITHDVIFHCFYYGIRVHTLWLTWLSLIEILYAGFKIDIAN